MKISILLPYKEKFSKSLASSVSITVKNNIKHSYYKNSIRVFGSLVDDPIYKKNFYGIKNSFNFFKSKNKFIAKQMCKILSEENNKYNLVEIHNRPYLVDVINSNLKKKIITLFLHNDPLQMKGSKSIKERNEKLKNYLINSCNSLIFKFLKKSTHSLFLCFKLIK